MTRTRTASSASFVCLMEFFICGVCQLNTKYVRLTHKFRNNSHIDKMRSLARLSSQNPYLGDIEMTGRLAIGVQKVIFANSPKLQQCQNTTLTFVSCIGTLTGSILFEEYINKSCKPYQLTSQPTCSLDPTTRFEV